MSQLEIHHLDVGQGDCTVILYFDDNGQPKRSVLLDCGKNDAHELVISLLKAKNFSKLDIIVLTHYDEDHILGLINLFKKGKKNPNVLKMLSGTKIWDRGNVGFTQKKPAYYDSYLKAIDKLNGALHTAMEETSELEYVTRITQSNIFKKFENYVIHEDKEDDIFPIGTNVVNHEFTEELDDFSIHILSVDGYASSNVNQPVETGRDENDKPIYFDPINKLVEEIEEDSDWKKALQKELKQGRHCEYTYESNDENCLGMGLLLKFGTDFNYWFGGDLKSNQEDALTNAIGQLSVLKAGHHGSNHSTSIRFLAETQPIDVVISTGSNLNTTVHLPDANTLDRLRFSPVQKVYLTGLPEEYTTTSYLDQHFSKLKEALPRIDEPYDRKRKFHVSGTDRRGSGRIFIQVDSTDSKKYNIYYTEKNLPRKFKAKKRKREDESLYESGDVCHPRKRRNRG